MADDLRQAVLNFAKKNQKLKVGRGECWDLPQEALAKANSWSSTDFDPGLKNTDYKWGKVLPVAQAKPGDILQFKGFVATVTTVTSYRVDFPDKGYQTWTESETKDKPRKHHSAIVKEAVKNGQIIVFEQHVTRVVNGPIELTVDEGAIHIANGSSLPVKGTKNVIINGTWSQLVKKGLDFKSQQIVDGHVKKYSGRTFPATFETKTSWTVTGTITAYEPVSKSTPLPKAPAK